MLNRYSAYQQARPQYTIVQSPQDAAQVRPGWDLGQAPILAIISALGLLLAAFADTAGRTSSPWAPFLFWFALLLVVVPIAWRLLSSGASRTERVFLLAFLSMALYGVKCLNSPLWFSAYDEYLHVRTMQDILTTHHLARHNPLLPISPLFPGLENVTDALVNLTGQGIYPVGLILIGATRLLLLLSLFLLYERLTQSPRIAGIGALVYMANPGFLFFDAQFAYESLAIALACFALYALTAQEAGEHWHRRIWSLIAMIALAATIATHHLTSYVFMFVVACWVLGRHLLRDTQGDRAGMQRFSLLALVAMVSWMIFTATLTVHYLEPSIEKALASLIGVVFNEASSRTPFEARNGAVSPLWERIVITLGMALIAGCAVFAAVQAIRRKQWRDTMAFSTSALVFPVMIGLRFVWSGTELASRLSGMIFIPLALPVALGLDLLMNRVSAGWRRAAAGLFVVTVVFLSGVLQSTSPLARLPGPYLAAADARSVEKSGIEAAIWARDRLGRKQRMAADRTNQLLMGSIGQQHVITNPSSGAWLPPLFYAPSVNRGVTDLIHQWRIDNVVVDLRFSRYSPVRGGYIEGSNDVSPGEQGQGKMSDAALHKFDTAPCASRIFDEGNIRVFRVTGMDRCS